MPTYPIGSVRPGTYVAAAGSSQTVTTPLKLDAEVQFKLGRWIDARRHGAVYDGFAGTDNTAAVNAALTAARQGDTVWIDPNALGCRIDGQLVIPEGVRLMGNVTPSTRSRFSQGDVLMGSVPENSTLGITSAVVSPIVLLADAVVEGFNFFYPNQNWDITSLAESFNTYPATVQLGNAANPNIHSPVVRSCNFLGASHCISQYATDGTPIQCPTIEDIGGWVLGGHFLRLNRTNDVTYVRRIHMNPNDVVYYALAKGADGDVFTAIAAKTTTVFHLGSVDDIRVDGFYFGCRTAVLFDDGMFTGDTHQGFGGKFDLDIDACHRAYYIKRGSNAFPVVINGWYTPCFRPNAVASDAPNQGFLHFEGANAQNTRIHVPSVRVTGVTNDAFPVDYTGQADRVFTATSAGANNRVMVGLASVDNINTEVVAAAAAGIVSFSQLSVADAAPTSTAEGTVLDRTEYKPGAVTAVAGGMAFAEVDADELVVSFRADTTFVEVELDGHVDVSAAGNLAQWGLFSGGALVSGSNAGVTRSGDPELPRHQLKVRLAVIPGTTYTWTWAHRVSVGTCRLVQGDDYGASVMTVRRAAA